LDTLLFRLIVGFAYSRAVSDQYVAVQGNINGDSRKSPTRQCGDAFKHNLQESCDLDLLFHLTPCPRAARGTGGDETGKRRRASFSS